MILIKYILNNLIWNLIKNKNQNLGKGEEALHTMEIIEAVRTSSKTGKKVTIKS